MHRVLDNGERSFFDNVIEYLYFATSADLKAIGIDTFADSHANALPAIHFDSQGTLLTAVIGHVIIDYGRPGPRRQQSRAHRPLSGEADLLHGVTPLAWDVGHTRSTQQRREHWALGPRIAADVTGKGDGVQMSATAERGVYQTIGVDEVDRTRARGAEGRLFVNYAGIGNRYSAFVVFREFIVNTAFAEGFPRRSLLQLSNSLSALSF